MDHRTLAIDGGTPIRREFLPFGVPCLGDEEIREVIDTLRSRWIGTGPRVERFEREFAEFVGSRHAVALNSCTSGLFLALISLGIGPGDQVITTPLTFAATVNVIEHVGARLVLADIDPETWNINPACVERAITSRTRAIIAVHFGGLACDMEALNEIAGRHRLDLIEDAAHAVGTRYRGRSAGTLARVASFSFYANKNLTTAEGGMVTTDDDLLAEKIRTLRIHGLSGDAWKRFSGTRQASSEILLPGYKCNMSDLAAAIGIPQLRKQEAFHATRERYARTYDAAFADLPIRTQARPADLDGSRHNLHLYALTLVPGRFRVDRDRVVEALLAENIGATHHYRPIHQQPFYRRKYGFRPEDFPQARQVGESVFSLPMTPAMTEADIDDVVTAVRSVLGTYRIS